MRRSYNLILLLACVAIVSSCNNAPEPVNNSLTTERKFPLFEKLNWLGGTWSMTTLKGTAYEVWVKKNDSTYAGRSFFVSGTDTVPQETMQLVETSKDTLLFIPTVVDQNEGKPVTFVMTSSDDNTLVFENPKHDFPQKVSYRQVTRDSMFAEISGLVNGTKQQQGFPMIRVK